MLNPQAVLRHPALTWRGFVTGSLLRHVFVMAATGAIGLVAVFAVDLINLFYISRLGEKEIAAAIGFAGVVAFFHVSIAIGLTIGITAVVSRTIGSGRLPEARYIATSSLVLMAAICIVLGSGTAPFLHPILRLLGATGETERLATRYLAITVHSLPLIGIGMACSALLRSVGDARASMNVTLLAAIVTALLDPVFIFVLGLGLDGAAIVSVLSRCVLAGIGLHGVIVKHRLLGRFERARLGPDARRLGAVAGPAVLSNLATPVAVSFITHSIAQFGVAAVAGRGHDRPRDAGRVRAAVRAAGRDRADLCAEPRCARVQPRAWCAARGADLHAARSSSGLARAGPRAGIDRRRLFGDRSG